MNFSNEDSNMKSQFNESGNSEKSSSAGGLSDEQLNKYFDELNDKRKKNPFDDYLKSKNEKFDNFFDNENQRLRSFRIDQDPIHNSKSQTDYNYVQMFRSARQRTDEIRKNWDESQFLSDSGRPDRPIPELRVFKFFLFCLT